MAHWRFWLSPSPHLFFFLVVLAYFVMLVMQWSEFVICNKLNGRKPY